MKNRTLVTGGNGFLGSYVVDELQRRGYSVTIVCRRWPAAARPGVRYLLGDVRDAGFIDEALANIDVVFHVAGNIRTPATDVAELHRAVNLEGTVNVLNACRHQEVERLIDVSTCEVYGEGAGEQVPEDAAKCPANTYAESKWLAEQECEQFSARGGLCVTVVRPSYIYGHGQFEERLFPRLIKAACATRPGNGLPPLKSAPGGNDFVYVRDVAEGAVILGTRRQHEPMTAFNLGSSRYTTVRAVFEAVREITGADFEEGESSSTAPRPFSLSMAKAAAAGFVPRYSLREGLVDYVARARAHGP